MAARSFRPDSATIRAAAAVFSQRVTVTFGSCFKNSEHCSSACPCETISRMSDSFVPGSASRLWSTRRRTLRTMEKLCFCMRIIHRVDEPAVLFSQRQHAVLAQPLLNGGEDLVERRAEEHARVLEQLVAGLLGIRALHALAGDSRRGGEQLRCRDDGPL